MKGFITFVAVVALGIMAARANLPKTSPVLAEVPEIQQAMGKLNAFQRGYQTAMLTITPVTVTDMVIVKVAQTKIDGLGVILVADPFSGQWHLVGKES